MTASTQIFRDSFSDGALPPSGPDGASTYGVFGDGGMTAGLKVSIFLTSSGVDIVRRGAADTTHVKPLEPLADMLRDFLARGGTIWACTPCVKSRGYGQENLLEGVIIAGSSVMHERIKAGAATLSF